MTFFLQMCINMKNNNNFKKKTRFYNAQTAYFIFDYILEIVGKVPTLDYL